MDPDLDRLLAGTAVRAAPQLIGWRLAVGPVCATIAETEAWLTGQRNRGATPAQIAPAGTDSITG